MATGITNSDISLPLCPKSKPRHSKLPQYVSQTRYAEYRLSKSESEKLAYESIQEQVDDGVGSHPVDFIGINRKDLLYEHRLLDREYVAMEPERVRKVQAHLNSVAGHPKIKAEEPKIHHDIFIEDGTLLTSRQQDENGDEDRNETESTDEQSGGCAARKVKVDPGSDVFRYLDPSSKKKERINGTHLVDVVPMGWTDSLGLARTFLVECDFKFHKEVKDLGLLIDCLDKKDREFESLQVMTTLGVPVWRFPHDKSFFSGVLRLDELESLLHLEGNEVHPTIKVANTTEL